jgi:hypothetical protein
VSPVLHKRGEGFLNTHEIMTTQQIAEVCHETNAAFCRTLGDNSQSSWKDAPAWQAESAHQGVLFHLRNPNSTPAGSHESWLAHKVADGWKYGPVKDPDKKEHPCIIPFDGLPMEQQMKDHLFLSIVRTLAPLLAESGNTVG